MLEIKNLHVSIDGKKILKGLNLDVKPGEIHAIMGPNGSGKSTLSSVIAGNEDYEVTEGSIFYKNENIEDRIWNTLNQMADGKIRGKTEEVLTMTVWVTKVRYLIYIPYIILYLGLHLKYTYFF